MVANFVFLYGLATNIWNRAPMEALQLAQITLALLTLRTVVRMGCVARIYGPALALGVPIRAVYANILNSAATVEAIRRFAWARLHGRPLKWLKTDHAYPSRAVLLSHKRPLGEILTSGGHLDAATLDHAVKTCPPGVRLGEHLVATHRLTVRALYEGLSFQQGLPIAQIDPSQVRLNIVRCLPERVVRRCRVLPFLLENGTLSLASPEVPNPELTALLARFTKLELRFHLLPPREFESLTAALL
jgi:bacteriophage N4 adsorption protein B